MKSEPCPGGARCGAGVDSVPYIKYNLHKLCIWIGKQPMYVYFLHIHHKPQTSCIPQDQIFLKFLSLSYKFQFPWHLPAESMHHSFVYIQTWWLGEMGIMLLQDISGILTMPFFLSLHSCNAVSVMNSGYLAYYLNTTQYHIFITTYTNFDCIPFLLILFTKNQCRNFLSSQTLWIY